MTFLQRFFVAWEEWAQAQAYLLILRLLELFSFLFFLYGLSFLFHSLVNGVFFSSKSGGFLNHYRTQAYEDSSVFGHSRSGGRPTVTLTLMGTVTVSNGKSWAILSTPDALSKGRVYKEGDSLPDGSVLKEVGSDYVVVYVDGSPVRVNVKNQGTGLVQIVHEKS